MTCPNCQHHESFQEQLKAIVTRRCSSCQKQFQFPVVMNAIIVIVLIGSANLIPAIMQLPFMGRLAYFLVVYYVLIWLFDVTKLFRRKYL